MRLSDAAKELVNQSPEVKAEFIVGNINKNDSFGVKFKREGTMAVSDNLTPEQLANLGRVYNELGEEGRKKLTGGAEMGMALVEKKDKAGETTGFRFEIDAKEIRDWGQFGKAFETFSSKEGSAPALKAALARGNTAEVAGMLKIPYTAPEGAAQEAPAQAAPPQPAKKPNRFKEMIDGLRKGGDAPKPADGPQSSVERPIDVASLAGNLGLRVPQGGEQQPSSMATFGGAARERSDERGVG